MWYFAHGTCFEYDKAKPTANVMKDVKDLKMRNEERSSIYGK